MQAPVVTEDPDARLVEAVARGCRESLDELVRHHRRWVRAVVFAATGDLDGTQDVCQQVWMKVWRGAASLDEPGRWRGWVFHLARNAALDARRRARAERCRLRKLADALRARRRGGFDGLAEAVRNEEHRRALKEVARLPERYRQPFVLRQLAGWSYRRIAETLQIEPRTVETRLTRARRMLRQRLGED